MTALQTRVAVAVAVSYRTRQEPEPQSLAGALPLVVIAYVDAAQHHQLHALMRGLELSCLEKREDEDAAVAIALLLSDAFARGNDELARATLCVIGTSPTLPGHSSAVSTLMALLKPQDKPSLNDAYDLVHLARDQELPELAFDVPQLCMRAHGSETTDMVAHVTNQS
ncbi:hypothetical protein ATCC90586_012210 [Pythium insidiosum]|nr:hypothetical protein ATCC90586_012210 [Pythium insidiosum]